MTTSLLRKLSPLALVCAVGFAVPGDEVAFHPSEGLSLTKKFSSDFTLRLADFSASAMGQEISPDMVGNPEVTVSGGQSIELSDEFVKVGGGRPLELVRLFDGLSGKMAFEASAQGESKNEETEMKSALLGKKVSYKWNDGESNYTVAWAEGQDGEAKLLEGLEEDMDFRYLLGEGAQKEGASWDIPTDKLGAMLFPGGSFKLEGDDAKGDDEDAMKFLEELDIDTDELLAKLFDGTLKATYAGIKDVDGLRLAEIALEADIKSSNDFSDLAARLIEKAMEEAGEDVGAKPTIEQFALEISFKGTGTLMWDAKAGHAHSFELTGEGSAVLKVGASVDNEGQPVAVKGTVEFEGEFHSNLEVSR
jgi:hypothetical protein